MGNAGSALWSAGGGGSRFAARRRRLPGRKTRRHVCASVLPSRFSLKPVGPVLWIFFWNIVGGGDEAV